MFIWFLLLDLLACVYTTQSTRSTRAFSVSFRSTLGGTQITFRASFRSAHGGAQITFGCRNCALKCLEDLEVPLPIFAGIQGSEITIMIIMIIMIIMHDMHAQMQKREIFKSTLGCAQITLGCRNHWKLCIEGWFARIQGSEITIMIIMHKYIKYHKCKKYDKDDKDDHSRFAVPWIWWICRNLQKHPWMRANHPWMQESLEIVHWRVICAHPRVRNYNHAQMQKSEIFKIFKSTLGCAQITLGCRNRWKLCIEGWFARIQGSEITFMIIMHKYIKSHKCKKYDKGDHRYHSRFAVPWICRNLQKHPWMRANHPWMQESLEIVHWRVICAHPRVRNYNHAQMQKRWSQSLCSAMNM